MNRVQLPIRDAKHVTETSSYKIFSRNIPDHWIIRDVSERDYGIDCYIELVNGKNQVTGELISVQLKGKQKIKWTKDNYFTFSGINISTTNYWMKFPTPVFICLVDLETEEVFYSSVKESVRKNFYSYAKQGKFSYKIYKKDKLEHSNPKGFLFSYFSDRNWKYLEININTFLSNYARYTDFIDENVGRDYFMGVDIDRVLYLKVFYGNIRFLCRHFQIEWKLKSISDYFSESQKAFGDAYDIHEHYINEIVIKLGELMPEVSLKIREHLTETNSEYWHVKDLQLFNLAINIGNDGRVPSFI